MVNDLQRMREGAVRWLVVWIDWLVWVLLDVREGVDPSPPVADAYQGGIAILPGSEVMKVQPVVVDYFKNEKIALVLQKVHEWVEFNRKKGSHRYQGETWTYNSYEDWHDKHFFWFTSDYFGTLIRRLEQEGFLISTSDAPFCRKNQKAYRVNYARIQSVLGCNKVQDTGEQSSGVGSTKFRAPVNKVHPYNSKDKESKSRDKQEPTATADARAENPIADDAAAAENKPDSGEYHFFDRAEAVTDTQDGLSDSPDGVQAAQPPPDFAGPPSALVVELCADLPGLLEPVARSLVDVYGERRCRDTLAKVKAKRHVENPPGLFIHLLEHDATEEVLTVVNISETNSRFNKYAGPWADYVET